MVLRGSEELTEAQAFQVFDGVMLSDGGLSLHSRNGRLDIATSDENHTKPHEDWLLLIGEALNTLGVELLSGHPRPFNLPRGGKPFSGYRLTTKASPVLTSQFSRWYPGGRKEVPEDLLLTPITLAHWFMGDGSSGWRGLIAIGIELATSAFSDRSVQTLENKLAALGLYTCEPHMDGRLAKGSRKSIVIAQGSVNDFMKTVEPFIVPSFTYKIKYRRMRFGS